MFIAQRNTGAFDGTRTHDIHITSQTFTFVKILDSVFEFKNGQRADIKQYHFMLRWKLKFSAFYSYFSLINCVT